MSRQEGMRKARSTPEGKESKQPARRPRERPLKCVRRRAPPALEHRQAGRVRRQEQPSPSLRCSLCGRTVLGPPALVFVCSDCLEVVGPTFLDLRREKAEGPRHEAMEISLPARVSEALGIAASLEDLRCSVSPLGWMLQVKGQPGQIT